MGEILNDGANRFTCFHCDFNLCRTCVRKNLKRMAAAGGGNMGSRKVVRSMVNYLQLTNRTHLEISSSIHCRTPSNISAASSMANINIYDNPTLTTTQAISRSRQGSKVKDDKVIQNHDEVEKTFLLIRY